MARITNTEILTKYREKLEHSRRWRKEERYDDLWSRLIDLYRGKHHRTDIKEDQLLINIAFATINVISPAVSINHPKIAVNAKRPEDADKAIVTEAIINYWWQHYGCQEQFRRAVKDFLICGHGWVKTGYRYVEEEKARDETPNFDSYDELATPGSEAVIESELIIKEDRAFLERVSLFDMFVDPDATSMDDIRWIAQRTRRPMDEVKKDKRYNATARNECAPSHYSKWGQDQYRPRMSTSKDDSYVEIWEWYDIDRNTMSVFCDGSDKFLVSPTKMPFLFGHPYTMIRNYDVPDYFYPMGELEAIEPLQYELNETRTQMMNHRKRYSRKWLAMESAFDDYGRTMLASDDDNVIVPVKGSENLNNVVVPMPAVINPPEFYNQSALIINDIDRVSGVSEYQRGSIPETTRTAREASIIAEAGNARVAEKLVTIENNIAKCAANLIMLAQQFMTGEQTVRIVGTDAAPVFLTFDKDYIAGQFDFQVEAGSTAPRNEGFRRDMALQMVAALQPFAEQGLVNMPKLAEYVLGIGFGVKDPQSFLQAPPPPPGAEGMPPGMEGMPPEGMMPPGMMPPGMEGMPPEGMMPPEMEQGAPPPGLESLPPEVLQALLSQGR